MMLKSLVVLIGVMLLLPGCERNTLCYDHPHGLFSVYVDWCLMPGSLALPEGARLSFYARDTRKEFTFYRETAGGKVTLSDNRYDLIVYNSDTETMLFRGMERFETAEAYLDKRTRSMYASTVPTYNGVRYTEDGPANQRTRQEDLIGETDRCFGAYIGEAEVVVNASQQKDTLRVTPESRIVHLVLTVKVDGIRNVRACRASLSGVARSLDLSAGKPKTQSATVFAPLVRGTDVYSCRLCVFGFVRSPDSTPAGEQAQQIVNVEFMLTDNTVKVFDVDVAGQIDFESICPEMVIPIVLGPFYIPDVEPEKGGGFDASVDDWGEIVDIPL